MAKEIIPPNPIPVGQEPITSDDKFQCATMIDSGNPYEDNKKNRSELIGNIIDYLEESAAPWGTSDEFWKAYALKERTIKTAKSTICSHVDGLSKKNMDDYLQILEKDGKIVVAVFLM